MIKLRKSCPEIGLGDYTLLDSGSPDILAIRYDYLGQSLIILHNFSDKPKKASFNAEKMKVLYDLMEETASQDKKPENSKFSVSLDGYGYRWYRVDHIIP